MYNSFHMPPPPFSSPSRVLVEFMSANSSRTWSRPSTTLTCKAFSTTKLTMWHPRSNTPRSPWMLALWTALHPSKSSVPYCPCHVPIQWAHPYAQLCLGLLFLVRRQHDVSLASLDGHLIDIGCVCL